jgi:hypothetical protein
MEMLAIVAIYELCVSMQFVSENQVNLPQTDKMCQVLVGINSSLSLSVE